MSNFANDLSSREKRQEHAWERRKEYAKYYFDLAKLTFAALVLGELVYLHNNDFNLYLAIVGLLATAFFQTMASNNIKIK